MSDIKTTVTYKTEMVRGKECLLTITKQVGLQEIMTARGLVLVDDVTIFEGKQGRSLCFHPVQPEFTPEKREAARRRIREVATKAMIDQGIW